MKYAIFERGTHFPILLLRLSMSGKTPKKAHKEMKANDGTLGKESESNIPAIRENKMWVKKSMVLSKYKIFCIFLNLFNGWELFGQLLLVRGIGGRLLARCLALQPFELFLGVGVCQN